MAPEKEPTSREPAGVKNFTPKEAEFIRSLFCNMNTRPNVNWDSVAADMSLKDASVAQARYRSICGRHGIRFRGASGKDDTDDTAGASLSPTKPGKSPRKRPTKEILGGAKIKKSPGKRGSKVKTIKTEEQGIIALAMAAQEDEEVARKPVLPYINRRKMDGSNEPAEAASEAETEIFSEEEDLATFSSPDLCNTKAEPKYHGYEE